MRPERGGGVAAVELMADSGGAAAAASPSVWRTPTPYLFLGLSAMMGVIVVALLVLLCTRRQREAEADGEKAASSVRVLVPLDRKAPRVVVIMAGDDAPSFLASAKPLALPNCGAEAGSDAAV